MTIKKNVVKTGVFCLNAYYWPQYSPDGASVASVVALDHSIGRYAQYCTAALRWPSKWPVKWVYCLIVVLLIVALVAAGAIWSK